MSTRDEILKYSNHGNQFTRVAVPPGQGSTVGIFWERAYSGHHNPDSWCFGRTFVQYGESGYIDIRHYETILDKSTGEFNQSCIIVDQPTEQDVLTWLVKMYNQIQR